MICRSGIVSLIIRMPLVSTGPVQGAHHTFSAEALSLHTSFLSQRCKLSACINNSVFRDISTVYTYNKHKTSGTNYFPCNSRLTEQTYFTSFFKLLNNINSVFDIKHAI